MQSYQEIKRPDISGLMTMVRVVVMPSYSVTMVTSPITSSGVVLSAITKSNDDVSKSFSVIPMAFKISRPPTDTSAPPSGMTLSMVERNWPLSSKTRRETVDARLHRRGFRIDPTTIRPLGAWCVVPMGICPCCYHRNQVAPPHSCRCRFHSGLYYYFSGVLDSAGKNDYFLRNYDPFFR